MFEFPLASEGWLRSIPLLAQGTAETAVSELPQQTTTAPLSSILMIVGLVCLAYWLIQAGIVRSRSLLAGGIVVGLVAFVAAGWWMPAQFEAYVAYAFFALAAAGAIGFLASREPVYAALGFTTAVLSICGILFMQSALFVAAATMIVYAGATIIIFLFVLMFAQQTELRAYDIRLNRPAMAAVIGGVLMATIAVCVTQPGVIPERRPDPTRMLSEAGLIPAVDADAVSVESAEAVSEGAASADAATAASEPVYPVATAELGRSLYTDYLAMVELAGVLLLVAAVGSIAMATRTAPEVNG